MSENLPGFGRHHVPTASGSLRPDEPIMWLSCEARGHVTQVSVVGEVDLSNAHLLAELLENVAARTPMVAVDLSEVTFFGANGTDALVRAHQVLTGQGGRLTLCRPSSVVRRVLEITGTLGVFEVVDRPHARVTGNAPARPVVPARAGS
ncbi:STAS domain-containing protein [Micromonospora schwarzwaldensis]|uniref:STAS domain-containing protein n=1 Tax=Micromonospora sp. DSM 45708 TaxID=3111767 RepID=UPI0031DA4B8F